jgi:hypothetical protein
MNMNIDNSGYKYGSIRYYMDTITNWIKNDYEYEYEYKYKYILNTKFKYHQHN